MSALKGKFNLNKFVVTAELFPPKGTDISTLLRKADVLSSVVDGINVTDNQRASMRLGSMAVCRLLKEKGYEAILQLTCRDRNRIALQSDLLSAYVLGIENILILSGDHPLIGEYFDAKPVYDLDTVQLISAARLLETGVDLAGKALVGAPRYCIGAVANPCADPLELALMSLEKKVNAGAEFIQTQPIFNVEDFKKFREAAGKIPVKMLAGVALLKSTKFVKFLRTLPGVHIPEETAKRMEASSDPLAEGIKICAETITKLKGMADGVHIMAIGMEEYIPEIVKLAGI